MKSNGEATLESMAGAHWYNKWLLNKFKKYLSGEILEIGCGIGNFTPLLEKFGDVTAIDIDKQYLPQVKNKSFNSQVGFGDIEKNKFFFKQKKFDTAIALNVLEHIKNDKQALININRILKPKGFLILLLPSHPKLFGKIDESIDHFRRYHKQSLVKLIQKKGFKIIKARRLNFLGGIGWWFSGKVLKNASIKKNQIKIFSFLGPFFLFFERFIEPPIGTSILIIARKS